MQAKRCVSALRCRQPPPSIASCPRRRQFAVAQADQGVILASKSPGIWRMSDGTSLIDAYHQVGIYGGSGSQKGMNARRLAWS
jgi:hypothetical protein